VYIRTGEYANWAIEHALLLILPLYYIWDERYQLITGAKHFINCYSVILAYHFFVLDIASTLTGLNINHMHCPPPAMPLALHNESYRLWTILISAVFILFIRYGYIGSCIYLMGKTDGNGTSEWLSETTSTSTGKTSKKEL
jgi:hypothetical protein